MKYFLVIQGATNTHELDMYNYLETACKIIPSSNLVIFSPAKWPSLICIPNSKLHHRVECFWSCYLNQWVCQVWYVYHTKWNPGPAPGPTPWNFQPHKFEVDTHATSLSLREPRGLTKSPHTWHANVNSGNFKDEHRIYCTMQIYCILVLLYPVQLMRFSTEISPF